MTPPRVSGSPRSGSRRRAATRGCRETGSSSASLTNRWEHVANTAVSIRAVVSACLILQEQHKPLARLAVQRSTVSPNRTGVGSFQILFIGDSTNRGMMHYVMEQVNDSLTEWDKTHHIKVSFRQEQSDSLQTGSFETFCGRSLLFFTEKHLHRTFLLRV